MWTEEHQNFSQICRENDKISADITWLTSSFTPASSFALASSELAWRREVQGVSPGSAQYITFTLTLTSLATYIAIEASATFRSTLPSVAVYEPTDFYIPYSLA
jgi:hypothetical protein